MCLCFVFGRTTSFRSLACVKTITYYSWKWMFFLSNAGLESSTLGPVYQNIEDFTKCSYEDLCNNKRASLYEVPVSLKKNKSCN